jgi:hypothetical protein
VHLALPATAEAEEMPKLASKLGVTGSDHLFLRFKRHAFTGGRAGRSSFSFWFAGAQTDWQVESGMKSLCIKLDF